MREWENLPDQPWGTKLRRATVSSDGKITLVYRVQWWGLIYYWFMFLRKGIVDKMDVTILADLTEITGEKPKETKADDAATLGAIPRDLFKRVH